MIFASHLIIALIFIISLYIGATYSSLRYELDEIAQFQKKIKSLLDQRWILIQTLISKGFLTEIYDLTLSTQDNFLEYWQNELKISNTLATFLKNITKQTNEVEQLRAIERQLAYYQERYNICVNSFNTRIQSPFALPIRKLFKTKIEVR